MNISIEQVGGGIPVTVMGLAGDLDAASFREVIDRAKTLYQSGAQNLLLDLGDVPYMASSGLVALHSIALIMRGQEPPDPDEGWGALHAAAEDVAEESGHERHFKLLDPQPRVLKTLQMTGFDRILAVYTDREEALAAFAP